MLNQQKNVNKELKNKFSIIVICIKKDLKIRWT